MGTVDGETGGEPLNDAVMVTGADDTGTAVGDALSDTVTIVSPAVLGTVAGAKLAFTPVGSPDALSLSDPGPGAPVANRSICSVCVVPASTKAASPEL